LPKQSLAKRRIETHFSIRRNTGLIIVLIRFILQVGRRRRAAMCRYLLNIVDVETLDPTRKRRLTNYLERRKKELETKLSSVNQALQVVKRRAKKRRR
jgi:hypothetical protein